MMDLSVGQVTNTLWNPLWGLMITKYKSRNYCSSTSLCYSAERTEISVLYPFFPYKGNVESYCRPLVARAKGRRSDSSDEDDHSQSSSSDAEGRSGDMSSINRDWRDFRAFMIKAEKAETDGHSHGNSPADIKLPGLKWAHPLSIPEKGCILIATEKLDGIHTFERTVILLFSMGSNLPRDGPFGVVINRPLNRKIREMRLNNNEVATTFADCSVHFGGPLEASIMLLNAREGEKLPGFEEVIPGLFFGTKNSLEEAATLVKKGVLNPHDFRFFVGYSGWQLDQLRYEIDLHYWHVAACSLELFTGTSENLWEEVLQLMGGQYSDLSRKPKQDR